MKRKPNQVDPDPFAKTPPASPPPPLPDPPGQEMEGRKPRRETKEEKEARLKKDWGSKYKPPQQRHEDWLRRQEEKRERRKLETEADGRLSGMPLVPQGPYPLPLLSPGRPQTDLSVPQAHWANQGYMPQSGMQMMIPIPNQNQGMYPTPQPQSQQEHTIKIMLDKKKRRRAHSSSSSSSSNSSTPRRRRKRRRSPAQSQAQQQQQQQLQQMQQQLLNLQFQLNQRQGYHGYYGAYALPSYQLGGGTPSPSAYGGHVPPPLVDEGPTMSPHDPSPDGRLGHGSPIPPRMAAQAREGPPKKFTRIFADSNGPPDPAEDAQRPMVPPPEPAEDPPRPKPPPPPKGEHRAQSGENTSPPKSSRAKKSGPIWSDAPKRKSVTQHSAAPKVHPSDTKKALANLEEGNQALDALREILRRRLAPPMEGERPSTAALSTNHATGNWPGSLGVQTREEMQAARAGPRLDAKSVESMEKPPPPRVEPIDGKDGVTNARLRAHRVLLGCEGENLGRIVCRARTAEWVQKHPQQPIPETAPAPDPREETVVSDSDTVSSGLSNEAVHPGRQKCTRRRRPIAPPPAPNLNAGPPPLEESDDEIDEITAPTRMDRSFPPRCDRQWSPRASPGGGTTGGKIEAAGGGSTMRSATPKMATDDTLTIRTQPLLTETKQMQSQHPANCAIVTQENRAAPTVVPPLKNRCTTCSPRRSHLDVSSDTYDPHEDHWAASTETGNPTGTEIETPAASQSAATSCVHQVISPVEKEVCKNTMQRTEQPVNRPIGTTMPTATGAVTSVIHAPSGDKPENKRRVNDTVLPVPPSLTTHLRTTVVFEPLPKLQSADEPQETSRHELHDESAQAGSLRNTTTTGGSSNTPVKTTTASGTGNGKPRPRHPVDLTTHGDVEPNPGPQVRPIGNAGLMPASRAPGSFDPPRPSLLMLLPGLPGRSTPQKPNLRQVLWIQNLVVHDKTHGSVWWSPPMPVHRPSEHPLAPFVCADRNEGAISAALATAHGAPALPPFLPEAFGVQCSPTFPTQQYIGKRVKGKARTTRNTISSREGVPSAGKNPPSKRRDANPSPLAGDAKANDTTHSPYSFDHHTPPAHATPTEGDQYKRRLTQRLKQIQFGKRTSGYINYTSFVARDMRQPGNSHHPCTPRADLELPKRQWDKILRQWRQVLHCWDDATPHGGPARGCPVVHDPCWRGPTLRHHAPRTTMSLGRGGHLLSCGDIESNPGPQPRTTPTLPWPPTLSPYFDVRNPVSASPYKCWVRHRMASTYDNKTPRAPRWVPPPPQPRQTRYFRRILQQRRRALEGKRRGPLCPSLPPGALRCPTGRAWALWHHGPGPDMSTRLHRALADIRIEAHRLRSALLDPLTSPWPPLPHNPHEKGRLGLSLWYIAREVLFGLCYLRGHGAEYRIRQGPFGEASPWGHPAVCLLQTMEDLRWTCSAWDIEVPGALETVDLGPYRSPLLLRSDGHHGLGTWPCPVDLGQWVQEATSVAGEARIMQCWTSGPANGHLATGRGEAITSHGDIEENPGPTEPRDMDDFMLDPKWFRYAVDFLCPQARPVTDAFANRHNSQCDLFWSQATDALSASWHQARPLWANPPFRLLPRIVRKLREEGGWIVLVCPAFRLQDVCPNVPVENSVTLPHEPLYRLHGTHLLPPPCWSTVVLLIHMPAPPHHQPQEEAPYPAWLLSDPHTPFVPQRELNMHHCRSHRTPEGERLLTIPYAGRTFLITAHALWDLRFPISLPCTRCHNRHWPWECVNPEGTEGPSDERPVCPFPTFLIQPPFSASRWEAFTDSACRNSSTSRRSAQRAITTYFNRGRHTADTPSPDGVPRRGGRGSLLSCGDIHPNPGPVVSAHFCPFPGCSRSQDGSRTGWADERSARHHVQSVHVSAGHCPPADWLGAYSLRMCTTCHFLVRHGKPCKGPQCTLYQIRSGVLDAGDPDLSVPCLPINRATAWFQAGTSLKSQEPAGPVTCATILGLRAPVLRRVPLGAADHVGEALGQVINNFCTTQTWEALQRLLLFPKYCLRRKDKSGKKHDSASFCRARLSTFFNRSLPDLWDELQSGLGRSSERLRKKPRLADPAEGADGDSLLDDPRTLDSIRRYLNEGAPGRAFRLVTSHGIHDASDTAIMQRLQDLHPYEHPVPVPYPLDRPDDLPAVSATDRAAMHDLVRSFPAGSAAGPSGLRPQHLLDVLCAASTRSKDCLLTSLVAFCQLCTGGQCSSEAVPWLCAATLWPLRKADGSVRPIAVGETLRRLTGKFLLQRPEAKSAVERLEPRQTAFRKGSPCSCIGMGIQEAINLLPSEPWVLLQVDLANAYNTLSRFSVLSEVKSKCRSFLTWIQQTLQPAPLICGDQQILSARGVQQGDPLGPFLFSLGIAGVVESTPPAKWLGRWYLDDGSFLCTLQEADVILRHLQASFGALGMTINLSKTTLWGPGATAWDDLPALPTDSPLRSVALLPWTCANTPKVLGVPLYRPGIPSDLNAHLQKAGNKLEEALNRVARLSDTQAAFCLLRQCVGPRKVENLLRTLDFSTTQGFAARVDGAQARTLGRLAGTSLTPTAWSQACLPISKGGCGLTSATRLAPAARVAGVLQFARFGPTTIGADDSIGVRCRREAALLQGLQGLLPPALEPLTTWAASGCITPTDGPEGSQRWWSERIADHALLSLAANSHARDIPRLATQASGGAGSWLAATPSKPEGLAIPAHQFQLLLRWHLGLPMVPASHHGAVCPKCQGANDIFGDHAVTCNRNGVWRRHFGIQSFICWVLSTAKVPHEREQGPADVNRRPADILLKGWQNGPDLAVDLTVHHPLGLGDQFTIDAAKTSLRQAGDQKTRLYSALCADNGWGFTPMVFDTWGGIHGPGAKLWKAIGFAASTGLPGPLRDLRIYALNRALGVKIALAVAAQLETLQLTSPTLPVPPGSTPLPVGTDLYGNTLFSFQ